MACPKCGVAVTPGYIKCPRCQAGLPRMPRAGRMTAGGGTAVEGPTPFPWLPVVVGAVAVGGVVAWLALRGGPTPAAAVAPVAPAANLPAPVAPPSEAFTPDVAVAASGSAAASIGDAAAKARGTATLEDRLKRERLWSKVDLSGAVLRIASALCAEAGMAPAVDEAAADLKAGGVTRVECRAGHGGLEWARDL